MFQLGAFLLGTDLCTVPKIYLLLPLYINRSITKKVLIKTLLKVTDSTFPELLTLESIISRSVSIGKFFVMNQFMYSGNMNFEFFRKLVHNKIFLIKTLLEMIESTSPRFFTLESIISKSFSIGNFFVTDRFMYGDNRFIGGRPHFKFFDQTGFF